MPSPSASKLSWVQRRGNGRSGAEITEAQDGPFGCYSYLHPACSQEALEKLHCLMKISGFRFLIAELTAITLVS